MRKIILASASVWRRQILEKTDIPFTVEVSDYEEDLNMQVAPRDLPIILATGKADTVASRHHDAIIIGVDTIAVLDGAVIGKPYTPEKAFEILRALSGKIHTVFTGYCIIDTKSGERVADVVETKVTFRALSDAEIHAYIETGEPLLAGGSYTIQGRAASFVSRIEGDFYSVVGLPLSKIIEELAKFGINTP